MSSAPPESRCQPPSQPRQPAKRSEMSLSNKQPAALSEYSQLCKGKNPDSFSGAFHCMESPKDFGKPEFEWQRTEGKLNEIGLNVNAGGPIKDGLVKNAGFTDEDKLCFFEGKLDKELKIAQKDKREIEVQGKKYQAAAGHLESWALISEPFPSVEGNFANPKATDFQVGQAGAEKSGAGLGKNEAITDQEKAAGKAGMETKCQPAPALPNLSVSESQPGKFVQEQETSVWNPNFHSTLPNDSGSKDATVRKDGAPSYCVLGAVNDGYVRSGFASAPTPPKPEPPTTTVELAQDDSKSSDFNHGPEMEEELEDRLEDGSFLQRAAHQRKAMRRAMSECSHLSVPLTLDLADKYPEPVLREDVATGLLSPNSSLTQCSSPTARKPSAAMKRSMTVAEEQTSVCSSGAQQSSAPGKEHQSLLAEEPAAKKREEWNGGSNSGKKELGSPSLYHSKLEQIPEIGSQDKEKEEAAAKKEKRNATDGAAGLDAAKSKGSELEPSKPAAAPLERKEIQVSPVQSSSSPKQGDLPRDGMLLIFTFQTEAGKELRDLGGLQAEGGRLGAPEETDSGLRTKEGFGGRREGSKTAKNHSPAGSTVSAAAAALACLLGSLIHRLHWLGKDPQRSFCPTPLNPGDFRVCSIHGGLHIVVSSGLSCRSLLPAQVPWCGAMRLFPKFKPFPLCQRSEESAFP